jgi:hypothetical protein
MAAVLDEAIRCFQSCLLAPDKHRRKLFREAEGWLMKEDAGALVSFREACEILGLNVDYIRKGLRQWQARQTGRAERRRARVPMPLQPLRPVESAAAG